MKRFSFILTLGALLGLMTLGSSLFAQEPAPQTQQPMPESQQPPPTEPTEENSGDANPAP